MNSSGIIDRFNAEAEKEVKRFIDAHGVDKSKVYVFRRYEDMSVDNSEIIEEVKIFVSGEEVHRFKIIMLLSIKPALTRNVADKHIGE